MPLSDAEHQELKKRAMAIRRDIVDVTGWSGGSHIGGALSQTDILTLLYFKVLRVDPQRPNWEDRDRFILSKGHGGIGYAVVLAHKGYFDFDLLRTFNHSGSCFGMHLDGNKVPGVDASTGSLGHGLPMAVGMALGARTLKKSWRTYCVVGDGECNEGSIWEAAMAAAHYKLASLLVVVDRNRLMIDGPTEDVMSLEPFADKWKAFGWEVTTVDGHNLIELSQAVDTGLAWGKGPFVIIANTVKGKGVDFMENQPGWHYGGLNSDLIARAKASIGGE